MLTGHALQETHDGALPQEEEDIHSMSHAELAALLETIDPADVASMRKAAANVVKQQV